MGNGNIMDFLKARGPMNIPVLTAVCINTSSLTIAIALIRHGKIFQIAEGMEYLHDRGVIHGDLRGVRDSLLLSDKFMAEQSTFSQIFSSVIMIKCK